MSLTGGDVLAVQVFKITTVVRNNRHAMPGCVAQLLRIRPAQLEGVSRCYRLTVSLREQDGHQDVYVLVQID